jgi:hypothetical protein
MRHVDGVHGQSHALHVASSRRKRAPKQRLDAVDVAVQLLFFLPALFRPLLHPLDFIILRLFPAVHQRPFIELAHIVPLHFARTCAQKPPAKEVLWIWHFVPAFPEQFFPLLLVQRGRVVCRGLQGAFAGDENADPKDSFDEAPREEGAAKRGMRGLGDAEGYDEDASWCHGAQGEDDAAYEDVVGDGVVQHDAVRVVTRSKLKCSNHL